MSRIGYVPALDGIRGSLIIAVIGVHYFGYPIGADTSMDVFFALSGFLITTLLLRSAIGRIGSRFPASTVGGRTDSFPRCSRCSAAYVIVTQASPVRGARADGRGWLLRGKHRRGLRLASPRRHAAMLAYWSLAQEEQFYLLWPLLARAAAETTRVRESRIASGAGRPRRSSSPFTEPVLAVGGATASRIYLRTGHARGRARARLRAGLCSAAEAFGFRSWAGWLGLAALFADLRIRLAHPRPHRVRPLAPMSIAATLLVGAAIEPGCPRPLPLVPSAGHGSA